MLVWAAGIKLFRLKPVRTPRAIPPSSIHLTRLLLLCLALALVPRDAFAYIDPGSGSMAYQVMLTGLLAAAFGVRRALVWIRDRFTDRHGGVTPANDSDQQA